MDGKIKVSFGIKTSKQRTLAKQVPTVHTNVEYISSFDSTCKPLGSEKPKEELVIPSKGNRMVKDFVEDVKKEKQLKSEESASAGSGSLRESLEQLAVKEIIEGAKTSTKSNPDVLTLPLAQESDANESTIDDYEEIPVEHFGKAMLRGMGWAPGTGIGKNMRVVAPVELQLRPKGLGLGADKMAVTNPVTYCSSSADKEGLSLANDSPTQIVAGAHKGMYGKVVSHNEDTGRCVVRLEIGGATVSVNENFLKPVTKEEYSSNARVLNAAKFNKYKESSEGSVKREKEYSRSSHRCSPDGKSHSDSRRRRERSRSPIK